MRQLFLILFLFLLIIYTSIGQKNQKSKYIIVTLRLKDKTLFNGCKLDRNLFDTLSCFSLGIDTVYSKKIPMILKKNILTMSIDNINTYLPDSLNRTPCYSIKGLTFTADLFTGMSSECTLKDGCINRKVSSIAKTLSIKKVYVEGIQICIIRGDMERTFPANVLFFILKD